MRCALCWGYGTVYCLVGNNCGAEERLSIISDEIKIFKCWFEWGYCFKQGVSLHGELRYVIKFDGEHFIGYTWIQYTCNWLFMINAIHVLHNKYTKLASHDVSILVYHKCIYLDSN